MIRLALPLAALALASCAHAPPPEPLMVPYRVEVPVMVTCAAQEPATKPYPDTEAALLAAATIFDQAKLLMAGRALRPANEAILRAARKGCEGATLSAAPPGATP